MRNAGSGRREVDAERSIWQRVSQQVQRFSDWQNQFSVVSYALGSLLALTLIVDHLLGQRTIGFGASVLWITIDLAFCVLALVLGRRYPRWLGLVFVAFLTAWSAVTVLDSVQEHLALNALLEVPMVAMYLGWFYRPRIARAGLLLHLIVLTASVVLQSARDGRDFSSGLAILYAILIAGFCLEAASYLKRTSERKAWYDPLTGVLNRRGFAQFAPQTIDRALRSDGAVTFALIDFDDFKAVNDSGGHSAGDEALRRSSAEWVSGLGEGDLVARTGGDEFVLLMHGDEVAAETRLRRLQAAASYPWSWGVTPVAEGDTLRSLMPRADAAMYRQKAERDR